MSRAGLLLLAAVLLCSAGVPPVMPLSTAGVPDWLIGTWMPVDVHQNKDSHYQPDDDPKHWYPGMPLTVTADRLSFFEFSCQGPTVSRKRGTLASLIAKGAGGILAEYDLKRETGLLDYLEIRCAHVFGDDGDGRGAVNDTHSADTWYVIVRSPSEIQMPYYHFSFVNFRKAAPTS